MKNREKIVEAKRKVKEAKRISNFKWGQDFDRSYEENKKKLSISTLPSHIYSTILSLRQSYL